jgi:hypothetical protein
MFAIVIFLSKATLVQLCLAFVFLGMSFFYKKEPPTPPSASPALKLPFRTELRTLNNLQFWFLMLMFSFPFGLFIAVWSTLGVLLGEGGYSNASNLAAIVGKRCFFSFKRENDDRFVFYFLSFLFLFCRSCYDLRGRVWCDRGWNCHRSPERFFYRLCGVLVFSSQKLVRRPGIYKEMVGLCAFGTCCLFLLFHLCMRFRADNALLFASSFFAGMFS